MPKAATLYIKKSNFFSFIPNLFQYLLDTLLLFIFLTRNFSNIPFSPTYKNHYPKNDNLDHKQRNRYFLYLYLKYW